jgi:hypothetical protein
VNLCHFYMETKDHLLHLFWNCNLVRNFWFVVENVVKICCITLPLNARGIIIVSPVLLRFMFSDCPIGIYKLLLLYICIPLLISEQISIFFVIVYFKNRKLIYRFGTIKYIL